MLPNALYFSAGLFLDVSDVDGEEEEVDPPSDLYARTDDLYARGDDLNARSDRRNDPYCRSHDRDDSPF